MAPFKTLCIQGIWFQSDLPAVLVFRKNKLFFVFKTFCLCAANLSLELLHLVFQRHLQLLLLPSQALQSLIQHTVLQADRCRLAAQLLHLVDARFHLAAQFLSLCLDGLQFLTQLN